MKTCKDRDSTTYIVQLFHSCTVPTENKLLTVSSLDHSCSVYTGPYPPSTHLHDVVALCFHNLFVWSGWDWSRLKSSCLPAEPVPVLLLLSLPTGQVQFMCAKSLFKESKSNKDMKELLMRKLQLETDKRYMVMFSNDSQLLPLGDSCPVFKDTRRVN